MTDDPISTEPIKKHWRLYHEINLNYFMFGVAINSTDIHLALGFIVIGIEYVEIEDD